MGEVNLIEGVGRGQEIETPIGVLPLPAEGPVTLAIRPEHVSRAADSPLCETRVSDTAFFGTYVRALLQAGSEQLYAHLPPDSDVAVGTPIRLSLDLDKVRVFPRAR
ncbi:MAG: TOBE domain-containing protein [Kiloniellales bacterium]